MLLRFMNNLVGLFGYKWVKESQPLDESDNQAHQEMPSHLIADEWEDLHQHSPRYRLCKKR